MKRNLYIIAGCNGAGKTTASYTVLPEILNCKEFVNADEIAKGLSPFQPENVSFEAGRIMISRMDDLIKNDLDFAFETTLSTLSHQYRIKEAKKRGYGITLLFFWLESVDLAKQRVKTRVEQGGHNIPPDVIERRYYKGLRNLFNVYMPICDSTLVYNNSYYENPYLICDMNRGNLDILDEYVYQKLMKHGK